MGGLVLVFPQLFFLLLRTSYSVKIQDSEFAQVFLFRLELFLREATAKGMNYGYALLQNG